MKKILLFAVAAFLFAATTHAQVQRQTSHSQKMQSDSGHRANQQKMINELNLSTDQKAQIKSLHEQNKQLRDAIKNDSSLTADQKRQKMKDLRKSESDKMNSILTPEQQAKRKSMIDQRKQNYQMNGKKMHEKRNADSTTVQ